MASPRVSGRVPSLGSATLVLILLATAAVGQRPEGRPFLDRFTPRDYRAYPKCYAVTQAADGTLVAANSLGVLEFDGARWRVLRHETGASCLGVAADGRGRVFVGWAGDLGWLDRDPRSGRLRHHSLRGRLPAEMRDVAVVRAVSAIGDTVLFFSGERIYRVRWPDADPQHVVVTGIAAVTHGAAPHVFWRGRHVVGLPEVGLAALDEARPVPLPGTAALGRFVATELIDLADGRLLVATESDGLFVYDGATVQPFAGAVNRIAERSRVMGALALADGRLVLSTADAGLLVTDAAGNVLDRVDQADGLAAPTFGARPFLDADGGIWLALDYGLARYEPDGPLREFDHHDGLEGGVLDVLRHDGMLFVATDRGLFGRVADPGRPARHRFAALPLPREAHRGLVVVADRIFCSSSRHLVELFDERDVEDRWSTGTIHGCLAAGRDDDLFVGTWGDGILHFEVTPGRRPTLAARIPIEWWVERIVPETAERLWLATRDGRGDNRLLRVEAVDGRWEAATVRTYGAADGLGDQPRVQPVLWRGAVWAVGDGLFRHDPAADRFVAVPLPGLDVRPLFGATADGRDRLWLSGGLGRSVCVEADAAGRLLVSRPLRRARPDPASVYRADADPDAVWIGTCDARLIRYRTPPNPVEPPLHAPLLRGRVGDELASEWLRRDDEITFEYGVPGFAAPWATRYRSRLVGSGDSWSAWVSDTERTYGELAPGDYRFEIQGRDVRGRRSSTASFSFSVYRPWFLTWWARLLLAGVSLALVFVAVRLRERHARRLVTRLEKHVAERTVQLRASQAELESAHRDLEDRVRQRTAELESANEALQEEMADRLRAEDEAERHRLDLFRSEKLFSLGTLVSGVAHEINNPNHFIMLNTDVLRDAWRDARAALDRLAIAEPKLELANVPYAEMRHEVTDIIDEIGRGSDRIRDIVGELRSYCRDQGAEQLQPVSVNDAVRAALTLLANSLKVSTRHFSHDLAPGLPAVWGDVRRIEQVIINLLLNACQALPDPGCAIRIRTMRGPQGRVLVQVEDEGVGVEPDLLPRLPDPFYTTRRAEGAKGLGLAVAARIAAEHAASLEFVSEPGRGMQVCLSFPVWEEPAGDEIEEGTAQ